MRPLSFSLFLCYIMTHIRRIEGLFTVQEEIGLIGAKALDGGIVDGRILLNLDAEDWPNIYVGCAGGGLTHFSLSCTTEEILNSDSDSVYQPALVTVGGLTGGVRWVA